MKILLIENFMDKDQKKVKKIISVINLPLQRDIDKNSCQLLMKIKHSRGTFQTSVLHACCWSRKGSIDLSLQVLPSSIMKWIQVVRISSL